MHIQISYDDDIARDTKIEEVIQKVCDEVSRVYGLEDDEFYYATIRKFMN